MSKNWTNEDVIRINQRNQGIFAKTKATGNNGMEEDAKTTKTRKPSIQHESLLQQRCVAWFRAKYPKLSGLLIAIPNAQKRQVKYSKKGRAYVPSANRQIAEGMTAGVADLQLIKSKWTDGIVSFHGLWIEMKFGNGKQSEFQKEFQKNVESQWYQYVVCRSEQEFQDALNEYLKA